MRGVIHLNDMLHHISVAYLDTPARLHPSSDTPFAPTTAVHQLVTAGDLSSIPTVRFPRSTPHLPSTSLLFWARDRTAMSDSNRLILVHS